MEIQKSFTVSIDPTSIEKAANDSGVQVAVVLGIASTFENFDESGDVIDVGAFDKTVEDYKKRKRHIKMKYLHNRSDIVGVFDPNKMVIDSKGLKVEGEINLETEKGREVYALLKQGAIADFSVAGYAVDWEPVEGKGKMKGVKGMRIKEMALTEISLVDNPANRKAKITMVKSLDLPVKKSDEHWNLEDATSRIGEQVYLYEDLFPVGDVIKGERCISVKGLYAASVEVVKSDLSMHDKESVCGEINRHLENCGLTSIFEGATIKSLTGFTVRQRESLLSGSIFSNKIAKNLASGYRDDSFGQRDVAKELADVAKLFSKG